jgi:hypothetical protein
MKIAFFGSNLVSPHWNGDAIYYRGLLKALAGLRHDITFCEPDSFGRQLRRDTSGPPRARVVSDVWGGHRAVSGTQPRSAFRGRRRRGCRTCRTRHGGRCPQDRSCLLGPRSCPPHLLTSCPQARRSPGGNDAKGRGGSMIRNIVPTRPPLGLPRELSRHLHFLWHACPKAAPVSETGPP